jgi:uncharacterized protein DUF4142
MVLLFANDPQQELKHDVPQPQQQGVPTDPLFDKPYVATDEPTFVRSVIESARQGELDARAAAETLSKPELREAATRIGRQNGATRARLEVLAKSKGWQTPEKNPDRAPTLPEGKAEARNDANFIVQQISFHENTVAQFRAQLNGNGDQDLKRELREALPGYEKNLELLLRVKL